MTNGDHAREREMAIEIAKGGGDRRCGRVRVSAHENGVVVPVVVDPCADIALHNAEIDHPAAVIKTVGRTRDLRRVPMAMESPAIALVVWDAVHRVPL